MTVTAQPARKIISGSGWSNPLSFANVTLENSAHLEVWADDTLLALGDDYSVSGVGDSDGFDVTIVDEELTPDVFVLVLKPTMAQGADLSSGGRFGVATEEALDALARRLQSLEDMVNRAVKVPLTTVVDAAEITIPAYSAGKALAWSATEEVLENVDAPGPAVAAAEAARLAAEGFAEAAEDARDATLEAYDHFDDRYLGAKAEAPTLDNDGDTLVGGALYFDSVLEEMRLWTGNAWVAAYVSGDDYVTDAELTVALALKAPLASPTFTGTVIVPDGSFGYTKLAAGAIATFAEFNTATVSKLLANSSVWGDLAVLTDAATIAVDFNAGYDFGQAANAPLALTGNRTLGAPTNVRNGKKGVLWFTATGGTRTLTLNAAWVLATGVEAGPYSITTAQTLGVAYVCRGTTAIVTGIVRTG